jgi:hypothetical protein
MVCERSVGEKDGEKTTSSWGLVCHFAKTAILLLAWLASVYILRRLRGWGSGGGELVRVMNVSSVMTGSTLAMLKSAVKGQSNEIF